jgi:hypothetical protein
MRTPVPEGNIQLERHDLRTTVHQLDRKTGSKSKAQLQPAQWFPLHTAKART